MWSPLHWATHYGDLEAMQVLLNCKADINSRTDIDRTPLHEAGGENIGANGLTAVRFMLEHGANANARMQSCQGTTPLYLASKYWEVRCCTPANRTSNMVQRSRQRPGLLDDCKLRQLKDARGGRFTSTP